MHILQSQWTQPDAPRILVWTVTPCFFHSGPRPGSSDRLQFTICQLKLKFKLIYERQSVGQSALVSGAHLGPATNFSFSLKFRLDSCGFIILWRPLWRDGGSVNYCTIASGPFQSSQSWVEVPQNSRAYFTVASETPQTWRARFPYLYLTGTGWPSYTPGNWLPFLSPLTARRATVEVFQLASTRVFVSCSHHSALYKASLNGSLIISSRNNACLW
jgi:hypothetical protein